MIHKFIAAAVAVGTVLGAAALSHAQVAPNKAEQDKNSVPSMGNQQPSPNTQTTGQGKREVGTSKEGVRNMPGDTRPNDPVQQQSREEVHNPRVSPDD